MIVDVHCHLDLVKNLDEALERAKGAGVKAIVANGVNPQTNRKVLELSEKYDFVKPALGIYPNDSLEMSDDEIDAELEFIEKSNPIAIGECGLDYKDEADKEKMKSCFQKQIDLAKKLNIPIIIHSRKAELDVVEMLEKSEAKKVVMHCFGGRKKLVKRIIENGWSFSIPAIITRLHHFQQIAEMTPMKQLLTETDAPFLSHDPEVPSEPAHIVESIKKIAEIKGMVEEEVKNNIFMNYQNLFL